MATHETQTIDDRRALLLEYAGIMASVDDVAMLPPEKMARARDIEQALDMSPEQVLVEALDIMAQTH